MSTLAFYAQFLTNKVGTNGLTVTWDVEQITRSDGTRAALVTGGATTITIGRRGLYGYLLAGADTKLYDYIATAITATTTVDQQEIAALWTIYEADALKIAAMATAVPGAQGGLPVLDANLAASANVTMQAGVAVAPADANGYILVNVLNWRSVQPAALDSGGNVLTSVNDVQEAAQQQIRDVMKLAPTAGAPAAGSIDAHLDDILGDTGTTLPGLLAATVADSQDVTTAGTISRRRGNSWSITLTLGAITGYTSLWFTIKSSTEDADSAAVLQIKKNASGSGDGLLYVNGAAASDATKASITIVDASTGSVLVTVDETITDDLTPGEYVYDAQTLISSATATPETGTFTVTADVTRSVT